MKKLTTLMFILSLFFLFSHASAFTVSSTKKYAWSNNVGYINFEHVTVSDSALSGYGWSANKGFIIFNPAQGGVLNDGTGNLSGSAWGDNLGWIDFNNVSINPTTGKFSGTATGALIGIITFDCPSFCDVETDWRPAATPVNPPVVVPQRGGGGGGGGIRILQNTSAIPQIPNTGTITQTPNAGLPPINPTAINGSGTSVTLPQVPNGTSVATLSKAPANPNANPGLSSQTSAENSPIFDIISSPIEKAKESPSLFLVLSILLEILILLLIIYIVRKIRDYMIVREKVTERFKASKKGSLHK